MMHTLGLWAAAHQSPGAFAAPAMIAHRGESDAGRPGSRGDVSGFLGPYGTVSIQGTCGLISNRPPGAILGQPREHDRPRLQVPVALRQFRRFIPAPGA